MKVTLREVSPIQRELEIVLPQEMVREELEAAYTKIGGQVHLKGFRPGKVPRAVLEQHYRQEAESEAVHRLIEKSYPEAIREAGLNPVSSPEVRVTEFEPSRGLTYEAAVEVLPAIDVQGYREMKLTQERVEVTEEEMEGSLKALQERAAQLVPVTDPRKPCPSDVVVIDYQGFLGETPVAGFTGKDYLAELGRRLLFPELEAGLQEMGVGEKKRIPVTLPPQWVDKNLAGKTVDYEVHLKEIKEKKLAELNDEFARDLGNFTSLEEVRAKVRDDLTRTKNQSARTQLRREVVGQLIRANEFLVPEVLVQQELEEMYRRLEGSLKSQGVTAEQVGLKKEDFFEKNREEALFRMRGVLLFDAVAQKEKITVTREEVDRRIEEMARAAGQSGAAWRQYYEKNRMIRELEAALREEKTLDFVLSQSTISVKE